MPTLPVDQLRDLTEAIFRAAGASAANAARVTEAMIGANLAGHDSHGVQHIDHYVGAIEQGALDPAAEPAILRETPTTALISGRWTFGHVGAAFATRLAMEKARDQHIAAVGLVQSHHIGRLGEYGEMGVANGAIVMIMAGFGHRHANQAPFGGARGALATNPIAIGIPAGDAPGMVLDFATAAVAAGKVAVARARGQQLPPGLLIDRDGQPTTDPNALHQGGALLPFGGHKGYALALAIEFLGRVLLGGETYREVGRGGVYEESGTLVIAINPGAFRAPDDYAAAAANLIETIKAVPPAENFNEVMVPGEPERLTREHRLADGIPVPETTWESILQVAQRYQIPAPSI